MASCVNEVADPELLELKENLYELVQLTEGNLVFEQRINSTGRDGFTTLFLALKY